MNAFLLFFICLNITAIPYSQAIKSLQEMHATLDDPDARNKANYLLELTRHSDRNRSKIAQNHPSVERYTEIINDHEQKIGILKRFTENKAYFPQMIPAAQAILEDMEDRLIIYQEKREPLMRSRIVSKGSSALPVAPTLEPAGRGRHCEGAWRRNGRSGR